MIEEKVELKVVGILWKKLFSTFEKALNSQDIAENELILFCDYSSFNIPIGYSFNIIKDINGDINFSGTIILKSVSQAFAIAYDSISRGDKTICKFEFPQGEIPSIVKELPTVGDWYASNTYLVFGNV